MYIYIENSIFGAETAGLLRLTEYNKFELSLDEQVKYYDDMFKN